MYVSVGWGHEGEQTDLERLEFSALSGHRECVRERVCSSRASCEDEDEDEDEERICTATCEQPIGILSYLISLGSPECDHPKLSLSDVCKVAFGRPLACLALHRTVHGPLGSSSSFSASPGRRMDGGTVYGMGRESPLVRPSVPLLRCVHRKVLGPFPIHAREQHFLSPSFPLNREPDPPASSVRRLILHPHQSPSPSTSTSPGHRPTPTAASYPGRQSTRQTRLPLTPATSRSPSRTYGAY